ncbi:MAG TPA: hypothetical protein VIV40_42835 [Kofleriaceae bacterium]
MRHAIAVIAVAVVLVMVVVSTGWADNEPWKQGVTPEQQQAAQQLLEAGNVQFLERNYSAALAKYEAAIAIWDHPAIRFNMVRVLVDLERFVEAYENLELALKYGAEPLEANVYAEALSYQKLLVKQVATVAVTCTQDSVQVTLDGQPLLACPGNRSRHVLPGHHQLVGRKSGYLTRSVEVVATGGKDEQVSLALQQIETAPSAWTTKRIVAIGLGAVAVASLGTGIAVGITAKNKQSEAHRLCPDPAVPCADAERSNELVRSGHRLATGANVMFGVATAAVLGGAVLWFMGAPASHDGVALAPTHNGFAVVGHF